MRANQLRFFSMAYVLLVGDLTGIALLSGTARAAGLKQVLGIPKLGTLSLLDASALRVRSEISRRSFRQAPHKRGA
jgi:hypothetical protein